MVLLQKRYNFIKAVIQVQNEPTNWLKLRRFSLRYSFYAFIDIADYLADDLFIKHKVTVTFLQEYIKDDTEYCIIFCRVRKRDNAAFFAALQELPEKMLLCGRQDYPAFCRQFMDSMEKPTKRSMTGKG